MTSQAGFSNLKQTPKLRYFRDGNVHVECVLPVTSQPEVGLDSSTQSKGGAPLTEVVVASKCLGQNS